MDWNNQPLDMSRFVADQVKSMNVVALAGMKSGQEIGRIESAAKIRQLESDCLTLALRLYGEDEDSFAPETREVMDRWNSRVLEKLSEWQSA